MPYALRLVLSSVNGLDRSAESAAISLGASNWVTLHRMTSPSTITLPVRMYKHITETIDPLIASLSATLIFITMILMFVLDRFYGLDKILVGKGN